MSIRVLQLVQMMVSQAEGGEPAGPLGTIGGLAPLVLMFVVIYFLLIRPANKQRRQQQELLSALKKDDEVVTQGGMYGRIVAIEDKVATLEIAEKVRVRIMRDRIAGRWNPSVEVRK